MRTRTVLIDPVQRAEIKAIEEVANEAPVLAVLPELHLEHLLLASLIQAGANSLELGSGKDEHLPPVVARRVTFGGSRDWALLTMQVFQAFNEHLPSNYLKEPKGGRLALLGFFLVALLHATKRRKNMVTVTLYPNLEEFREILPPSLFIPIRALLANLQTETLRVPVPRASISAHDVRTFEQVLLSDEFAAYTKSHARLDENDGTLRAVLQDAEGTGRMLSERFPQVLELAKKGVSVLRVSAKLIDATCGKLPGALADTVAEILEKCLNEERRVVVYRMDRLKREIMSDRFHSYARMLAAQTPGRQ